ncbi:MAG: PD40 domain-containing protein [Deltaproteobacteria bacterium]|nr:PD40 domain-containing protein [Deltaproteobacteria bacterium]
MRRTPFFVVLGLTLLNTALAGQIYIPVGEARVKKSVVAFPDTKYMSAGMDAGDSKGLARLVRETIGNDLAFTNLFTMQDRSAFIEKGDAGLTLETFRISDWTTIGTEFLVKTGISFTGENISYEMRLYDVLGAKQIVGKRYVAKQAEPKVLAHSVANDIVTALTGKPGIFFTKIAMVCKKGHSKEIWVTDFDGSNPKQLTSHGTLAFAPAWSTDNRKIAYSLYTKNSHNIKNIDLYEYDFGTHRSKLLSNRKGINSGAAYSPDGRHVALTMSFLGNPDIFLLDPVSKEVTRLTKSLGTDVDPAWSPDGKRIAFVSTRSNQPMVYVGDVETMKTAPSSASRLTFAGKYNATPTWSPDGRKIAFASINDSRFDLFLMGTDGTNLERLTKDEGSNEDPHFSPDGNFIAFSSNRAGQKNVYVITVDGKFTKRLTFGLGECEAPKWSWPAAAAF